MKQPIYNTALYLRLSRDDEQQGESASIQTQRTMLQTYARDNHLHVVGEYVDDCCHHFFSPSWSLEW